MAKFCQQKTIAQRQGKNTLCGDMVQSLFFFGAKCKELRGYGTISKQKNWQKRENILKIWDNPFFFGFQWKEL